MPAVASPAKILVTGASGFLATHVITQLLKDGYEVVGTGQIANFFVYFTYALWSLTKLSHSSYAVEGALGLA
jgi:hypothetical protein